MSDLPSGVITGKRESFAEVQADAERVPTEHPRVFYRSEYDEFGRGEKALAKFVAEHIPVWDVVLTMGPYRMDYEVAYELFPDERIIHIDCYSAAFVVHGEDVDYRKEHPAVQWAESAIGDIARGIKECGDEYREELIRGVRDAQRTDDDAQDAQNGGGGE